MEEKISVRMTEKALYDFLLYHTYSRFSGFLINVLGAAVGIMGIILLAAGRIGIWQVLLYLVAAAAFIGYTPLQLKLRAKKQMQTNPGYQKEWVYTFGEDGIHVSREDKEEFCPWEKVDHTVTAPKTIGIYYGKDLAYIIPKECFGQKFVSVIKIISAHIGPQNVKLR